MKICTIFFMKCFLHIYCFSRIAAATKIDCDKQKFLLYIFYFVCLNNFQQPHTMYRNIRKLRSLSVKPSFRENASGHEMSHCACAIFDGNIYRVCICVYHSGKFHVSCWSFHHHVVSHGSLIFACSFGTKILEGNLIISQYFLFLSRGINTLPF